MMSKKFPCNINDTESQKPIHKYNNKRLKLSKVELLENFKK